MVFANTRGATRNPNPPRDPLTPLTFISVLADRNDILQMKIFLPKRVTTLVICF
jgi:hypothetical protein